jgi:hypothetical protein
MIWRNLESFQEGMAQNILNLKSIQVGEKEIYPLVKVVEIDLAGFHAQSIEPIALVIIEKDDKYLISLSEQEPSPDLLDLVK